MTEDIQAWLKGFGASSKWINTLRSEATIEMYTGYLAQYCKGVNKNPDELIALKIEGLRNVATAIEFQAEDILDKYLCSPEITDNIKVSILCAVKSFYKANWRELNANVGKNLSVPQPKQRTPKMQDILELESVMTYQRDKSILWFLESAPFRGGTATKLFWKDLKSTSELLKQIREDDKGQITRTIEEDTQLAKDVPYYLVIEAERLKGAGKGKYKGIRQIGFLHYHAAEKLKRYKEELKQRGIEITPDSPLFMAYEGNPYNKGKGDRLKSVALVFYFASLMAWKDIESKKFSAQDFRDVLQSALENANVHQNIAAPLLGHKVKGVDQHYSNHELEEFLQAFRGTLPWMVPQTVEQVKADTQKKLEADRKKLTNLEFDNTNLKSRVNTLNTDQEKIKNDLAFLKNYAFTVAGVIESNEDIEKVQEFLEKMRKEKENKNETKAWET
jgi:hypothetical protein